MSATSSDLKYPKHVVLIFVNEFCERFCFYGLRALLTLYLQHNLRLSEAASKEIYHGFIFLAYFFPLVGAIVADSWMGKFATILYFSLVYTGGTALLALSATPPLGLPPLEFGVLALLLIAAGTGGIKPCVSAFGADQFVFPEQEKQMTHFFHMFYFSINLGSGMSMLLTPALRHLHCFGAKSCYSLAYGVPSAAMAFATLIFFVGKPTYTILIPEENVLLKWFKCIGKGIKEKFQSGESVAHWLDRCNDSYGSAFVESVKQTLRITVVFIPIVIFWSLFDQQGSGWTIQANLMDGDTGAFAILPEQMQTANAFLILILIPLFSYVVYPLCGKFGLLTTPLQRMAFGGIVSAVSFFLSAFLALQIEKEGHLVPSPGESHIRIYNPLPCSLTINAPPFLKKEKIDSMEYRFFKRKGVEGNNAVNYTITGCEEHLNKSSGEDFMVNEEQMIGFYSSTGGLTHFEDDTEKHADGCPKVRTLVGNPQQNVTLSYETGGREGININSDNDSLIPFETGKHTLAGYDGNIRFQRGGVYTVLIFLEGTRVKVLKVHEVTERNKLHMLLQVPQYFLITVGEVLLSPTGLQFAYTQAPASMKSVMTAIWLLTVAFGNLLVAFIDAVVSFGKSSTEFFVYGSLMVLDMIVFIILAVRYHYVDHVGSRTSN